MDRMTRIYTETSGGLPHTNDIEQHTKFALKSDAKKQLKQEILRNGRRVENPQSGPNLFALDFSLGNKILNRFLASGVQEFDVGETRIRKLGARDFEISDRRDPACVIRYAGGLVLPRSPNMRGPNLYSPLGLPSHRWLHASEDHPKFWPALKLLYDLDGKLP
jgi:hypothetical protein